MKTGVEKLTDVMAHFLGHTAIRLPDDVIAKLEELRDKEDHPLAKVIYRTMFRNQRLAEELQRPVRIRVSRSIGYAAAPHFLISMNWKTCCAKPPFKRPLRRRFATTRFRLSMNTIQARMSARGRRLSGGISSPIRISVRSTPTCPAAAARFPAVRPC